MKITSFQLVFILVLILFQAATISCDYENHKIKEEKKFPVEVKVLDITTKLRQIEYFGMVSSEIVNYSFLTGGRVEEIFVKRNQFVEKGEALMRLETHEYKLALNAAKNQTEQAENAYLESKNYYDLLEKATQSGGVAESDLIKAKLDRDIKFQIFEQSKIDVKAKQSNLNQCTLYAKSQGIVSYIIPKTGELVNAGAETIIIHGDNKYIDAAISQKDLEFLKVGTSALIEVGGKKIRGQINHISNLPDMQSFRYETKIEILSGKEHLPSYLGQTAKIYFETKTIEGIWVPIKYILNDGLDFVNVVENNRMRRKNVSIIDFSGDEARVTGLAKNEKLITKGASTIKEGYKVKIINTSETSGYEK